MTPNLRAFLAMVAWCEVGTDAPSGYSVLFGGGKFDSFADHPRIRVDKSGYSSTAAGRYQILATTWDWFCREQGKHDFSPDSQDLCARFLIERQGKALADVEAGHIEAAIAKCGRIWASLPGSPYGQPVRTLAYCLEKYRQAGGVVAPVATPAQPSVGSPAQVPTKRNTAMDPLTAISIFGPLISQLIPQVAKIFGGGDRAQQNVAAATTVLDTVVKAAGAANEQEAIAKMQASPETLEAVTKAVVTEPSIMAVLEVGGGLDKARADDIVATQGAKPFWFSPAFWITLLVVMPPVDFTVYTVVSRMQPPSEQLVTQVVTGILGLIAVAAAFYYGTTYGSQKKDETIAQTLTK